MGVADLGRRAKAASRVLATASTEAKDAALAVAADLLVERGTEILDANADDVARAEADGVSATVVDRLRLSAARIEAMAAGLRKVAALPDPVGEVVDGWVRPNGLRIQRVRVPLGVVAIIYENRPNVTSDAFGLCLKSGNAAFLRGSSGAIQSNVAIAGGAARRADEGRPARRRPRARRRHQPRSGGRVHAPARVHRLPHPARWAVADPRGARQRHRAVRHRRRRQLPRVRRRVGRSRHGARHRRQREDATPVGLQRRRVGGRARSDRVDVPAASRGGARGRRAGRRRRGPGHRPDGCRHRRRLRDGVPRPQARGAGRAVARRRHRAHHSLRLRVTPRRSSPATSPRPTASARRSMPRRCS